MEVKIYDLPCHGDHRGGLVAIEQNKDIPFEVKRVYYIYGVQPGQRRGFHAHKCLQQILVCLGGSCRILLDDGKDKAEILLDRPDKGLFVDNAMWREMFDFSENATLLVLASEYYDEADYIRNYDDFIKYVNSK